MSKPTLFELSRNGGCGCKVSPAQLRELLGSIADTPGPSASRLLVGNSSADDCAAWQLSEDQVLVSTTDFFMPVVNNPVLFGKIAATNAISDIYAMGAKPIFALALLGMPVNKLSPAAIAQIMIGGKQACSLAGISIGGGHTIDCAEPIFGLAVNGLCHLSHLCRNDTAQDGDVLILSKPLGIGILSNALRKGALTEESYAQLQKYTTQLNTPGPQLAELGLPSAMTDVTGFGLLGHALEMARGAQLHIKLQWEQIPILDTAIALVNQGFVTGASKRNWDAYGHEVKFTNHETVRVNLLTDPQTSGGLLIACPPSRSLEVVNLLQASGFNHASCIGSCTTGKPCIEVVTSST